MHYRKIRGSCGALHRCLVFQLVEHLAITVAVGWKLGPVDLGCPIHLGVLDHRAVLSRGRGQSVRHPDGGGQRLWNVAKFHQLVEVVTNFLIWLQILALENLVTIRQCPTKRSAAHFFYEPFHLALSLKTLFFGVENFVICRMYVLIPIFFASNSERGACAFASQTKKVVEKNVRRGNLRATLDCTSTPRDESIFSVVIP